VLSFAFGYNEYSTQLEAAYDKYEEIYGVSFNLQLGEYENLTPEQVEIYEEAYKALNNDKEAVRAYNMVLSLTLVILSLSILLAYAVLEFVVPLLFGNGMTLGKKIFNVALMRVDGVKVTPFMLFVRTFLGKYTLETMIPVLILVMLIFGSVGLEGTIVLGLILLLQVGLLLLHNTRSVIHDLLACTVAVDYASQMMFDTPESLLEYKKRLHAEAVENSDY
jgi:uncharacterized RDD family membrane protein YckC